MRGRSGGMIGTSPTAGSLSGLWRASEIYAMRVLDSWPRRFLSLSVSPEYADATESSQAEFFRSLSSDYPSTTSIWEKSVDNGATWTTVSGANSDTLTLTSQTIANDGDLYRATATAGLRVVYSSPVSVRFDTILFTVFSQPQNTTVPAGQTAYFYISVGASGVTHGGSYSPSYQWQRLNGSLWQNMVGETSDSIGVLDVQGRQYRVRVSVGGNSLTSNAATLNVT